MTSTSQETFTLLIIRFGYRICILSPRNGFYSQDKTSAYPNPTAKRGVYSGRIRQNSLISNAVETLELPPLHFHAVSENMHAATRK